MDNIAYIILRAITQNQIGSRQEAEQLTPQQIQEQIIEQQREEMVTPQNFKQIRGQGYLATLRAGEILDDLKDDNKINGSPELKRKGDSFAAYVEQRNARNGELPEDASENLRRMSQEADSFISMVARRQEIFGDVLAKQKEKDATWAEATIPEGEYKPEKFTERATGEIKDMDAEKLGWRIISDTDTDTKLNTGFNKAAYERIADSFDKSLELMKNAY